MLAARNDVGAPGLRAGGRGILLAVLVLGASVIGRAAAAAEATVAVAANFLEPAKRLKSLLEERTDHEVTISAGSTGQLYAQIVNGAPYDVLLSADEERPRRLEDEGLAVEGSRFAYAVGRLALWSADPKRIGEDGAAALRGDFRHLAIAEPKLAPYGAAAKQTLEALGLWSALEPRIVRGQDIGQTFQFVATGNAELGLVGLSQVLGRERTGSYWIVPATLHAPVRQDAVLLERAKHNAAAAAFLDLLRSSSAAALLASFGYDSGSLQARDRE